MPITIECLSENPTILIATCTGFLTIEDFKGMFEQVAEMVEGVDGQIYRVADYRQAESSFVDIMKTVQAIAETDLRVGGRPAHQDDLRGNVALDRAGAHRLPTSARRLADSDVPLS